ncbi:DUF2252 family protein [Rhizobium leguminosarum]|uniref:DUF2252 family protein n=1 Tax=Rhizobium leguminosarum TaxID=384 RepID=UPI001C983E24|nr:DUF2252 family protein [Rhizobium leguminosarum]MBY5585074.1 DUF2252 family protein [Rhizobium leguminosarum]
MPNADDISWFKAELHAQIGGATTAGPFDLDMMTGLACQETGKVWPILRHDRNLAIDRIVALWKHHRMARAPFMFFRATCFRFARKVANILPDLSGAPHVTCVGDANIENWGQDTEGGLVWGVKDFDEAALLPYNFLQLATSVHLTSDLLGASLRIPEYNHGN